jgi:hypothetical protein
MSYTGDPQKKVDIVAAPVGRGADLEPGRRLLCLPVRRGSSRPTRGMHKEILKALEGKAGGASQDG